MQARQQPTFPAALLHLIHQEFNESFRQELKRRQRVRWPNFKNLLRDLATGNFRPELVALPGGIAPPELPLPPPAAPHHRASATTQPAAGTTPTPQAYIRRGNQVQEHNPHPTPQMQIWTGFRIRTAINASAADGVDIPHTDNIHHFCLSYHLKSV